MKTLFKYNIVSSICVFIAMTVSQSILEAIAIYSMLFWGTVGYVIPFKHKHNLNTKASNMCNHKG